ncbi:AIPR family protein [Streptomyces sp. NPDC047072]|uniref:AIPR family protein n=1 Tax=Streptomyces sp. NPDC047072 TaxID=3154809 RepID=UPI0033FF31AA
MAETSHRQIALSQNEKDTALRQVRNVLDETYSDLIDMSDFGNRRAEDLQTARRSRSLAAHGVRMVTGWSAAQAAQCVIDGGQDQGIDAIAVVPEAARIYLIQAKWSEKGKAYASEREVRDLFVGLSLIDSGQAAQFNQRGRVLAEQAKELLDAKDVVAEIVVVFVQMSTDAPSPGVFQAVANGKAEFNHQGDVVGERFVFAQEIHETVRSFTRRDPVNLDVSLFPWFEFGSAATTYTSYVGVLRAEQIATWARHETRLFELNLRNPLGVTRINTELVSTLTEEPSNFWYYNNGITILCERVETGVGSQKIPWKYPLRLTAFGASVVNGAQTVRAIIEAVSHGDEESLAELAEVNVRFIVTGKDRDFAQHTTKATNRQNDIQPRDYIALESVQSELAQEFRTELGLVYSVRRGELAPRDDEGCSNTEAATALACAHNDSRFAARLVAAGSTDVLWERGAGGVYDTLFRTVPGVYETWNAVLVLRAVRAALSARRERYGRRTAGVIETGTFLIAHLVLKQLLAEDPGIGEPDEALTWAKNACEAVPSLVDRTVPLLVRCMDDGFGPRSDLKHLCADANTEQRAALVAAVLAELGSRDPAAVEEIAEQYLRQIKKPRRKRRPNAVHVLVDQQVLPEGSPLRLNIYIPVEQEALAEWLAGNERRSRATWTNNRTRPIVWAADGNAYSPSGLIARMWELAEWEERPVSNQGTERWVTEDGETLAYRAWRLLDGLEGEGETDA